MHHKTIADIRAFNRFYTGFLGLLDRYLLDSGFSLPEARILFEISRGEGVQASDIVDRVGIDKGYLSRILEGFVSRKLVLRRRSEADGRRMHIFLTDKGRREFDKLDRASDNQLRELLKDLSPDRWSALKEHMEGITAILSRNPPEVGIRTGLQPGDIGYLTYLHGRLYKLECDYGLSFEAYVAQGLAEFYHQYDPDRDRVWVCEHQGRMVGFLLLMHRGSRSAQLRYFILEPAFRGLGLGKKLMDLLVAFAREKGYDHVYLWTTHEQETAIALYKRHGFVLTEEKPSTGFGKALREQRFDLVL